MSSKKQRIAQEVSKMMFLAESSRKFSEDNIATIDSKNDISNISADKVKGPFDNLSKNDDGKNLSFIDKYSLINGGGETFKEDMALAFMSLKDSGKSFEEIINILSPSLNIKKDSDEEDGDTSIYNQFINFIDSHKPSLANKGIDYDFGGNKLTPKGFYEIQFLSRIAKGEVGSPEEEALLSSRRSDLYKSRAQETLKTFYKKAALPFASAIMGRDSRDTKSPYVNLDFNIALEKAINKAVDNISSYDISRNNFGAWLFSVLKNDLIDTLKKTTTQKLISNSDVESAFEANDWRYWKSTLNPEIALGENGGIDPDSIANVKEISQGIWDYQFKTALDAFIEFDKASKGESNSIFLKDNLLKSEINKLKDVGAFLSVRKDADYEDINKISEPAIDPELDIEKDPMKSVDADESYDDVFNYIYSNSEDFQGQVKDKLNAYLKENGPEELGRALMHFIKDFDYKFFKSQLNKIGRSDFEKLAKAGKDKYGKDWSGFPKEGSKKSLGKKYLNDEGDIYPELEPYVDSKMVKRGKEGGGSGVGTKISMEEFENDQKQRGAKPLKSSQLNTLAGAAGNILKNGIKRNSKLGKTIEKLFNYERGNLEETMDLDNDKDLIAKLINEAIAEVLNEASGADWSEYYKERYTGDQAQKQMSQSDVDTAEKEVKNIAGGNLTFDNMTSWLSSDDPKYYYALDRMVEEYQKSGNQDLYTWILSFYSTNEKIKNVYQAVVSKFTRGIDPVDVDTWIDEGIMEKMNMAMQKFDPSKSGKANFHAYTFRPQRSHILRYVQTRIEKKYGEESLDSAFGGGDADSETPAKKDQLVADPSMNADAGFQDDSTSSEEVEELKIKVFNKLNSTVGPGIANAYHDYYIKGAKGWGELVSKSSEWDRYKLRGPGKAKLLKSVLAPNLEKLGFSPSEIKSDFKVDKYSGSFKGMDSEKSKKYEAAISGDNTLKKIYNLVVKDVDVDFANPSTLPFSYIINPTGNARAAGSILGDLEANIRSARKKKIDDEVNRLDIKYPGIKKVLLSNPLKAQKSLDRKNKKIAHSKGIDF